MIVNGHLLPFSFIRATQTKSLTRSVGSWQLKTNLDCYGNHLETDLGWIHETVEEIQIATDNLCRDFVLDISVDDSEYCEEPGFIPYITDFANVIEFAISGDGSPFCFDYRDNAQKPQIIWWDDVYWRKISDDYDSFIVLFETNS